MTNTLRYFTRALSALAFAAMTTGAWAAPPRECGLVGSWIGSDAGSDMIWIGTHTPSSTASKGQMVMDWVYVADQLGGGYPMTPGTGVWEQVGNTKQYNYTWFYFVSDPATRMPIVSIRVRGDATVSQDCNSVAINYTYEVFPFPPDYSQTPLDTKQGTASETRMAVFIATP